MGGKCRLMRDKKKGLLLHIREAVKHCGDTLQDSSPPN